MRLLDHFHPPLSLRRHWQGLHSAWANAIVQQLNGSPLPQRFHAAPIFNLPGSELEADVPNIVDTGGSASWSPPRPMLTAATDFDKLDSFGVQVFYDEGGPRLTAAIELVSPSNKDRPGNRRAFATKCANYLVERVAVVVVDVVTDRQADLHAELLRVMHLADGQLAWRSAAAMSAFAYRPVVTKEATLLEVWAEALAVGRPLPTLPLWIAANFAVPLDLEQSYAAACRSLRIEA